MSAKTPVAGLATEKSFHFSYYSETDRKQFTGQFTVKRPTIVDQIQIEAEKSRLLGGKYYDPNNPGSGVPFFAHQMAETLAFLKVCIVNAPEWWGGGDSIHDMNLLAELYEIGESVDPFRTVPSVDGGEGANSGGSSDKGSDNTDPDAVLKEMVD